MLLASTKGSTSDNGAMMVDGVAVRAHETEAPRTVVRPRVAPVEPSTVVPATVKRPVAASSVAAPAGAAAVPLEPALPTGPMTLPAGPGGATLTLTEAQLQMTVGDYLRQLCEEQVQAYVASTEAEIARFTAAYEATRQELLAAAH